MRQACPCGQSLSDAQVCAAACPATARIKEASATPSDDFVDDMNSHTAEIVPAPARPDHADLSRHSRTPPPAPSEFREGAGAAARLRMLPRRGGEPRSLAADRPGTGGGDGAR